MAEDQNAILVKFLKDFEARFSLMQEELDKMKERLDAMGAPESQEDAQKKNELLGKIQDTLRVTREEVEKIRQQQGKQDKRLENFKSESHFGTIVTIVVFSFLFILTMFMRS
ncbi:MAG: hypothetical protein H7833_00595 [Magnetococcus sp. DMHC-1]|nr:hypothetical protein [Magnetococcales bacterium]